MTSATDPLFHQEQRMAVEWFYTTNKQQMGPVSWMELHELAQVGILKPRDLVWSEGMDEWIQASAKKGLFADGEASARQSSYAEAKPPGRRIRRQQEDEDDDDDERDTRKQSRRRREERAKTAIGLKVGLILGGVFLLLLFLGSGVGGLVWLRFRDDKAVVGHNYTIRNLFPQRQDVQQFNFQQGQRVVITVTNNLVNPMTDVDLFVHRGHAGNPPFAFDQRMPQQDRNCRVEFI